MGFLSGVSSFIEKHSEAVHAVLDVAGFIPVVGAVADIANTALYIHEGDAVNAVMCGIAAIPGIGDLAWQGSLIMLLKQAKQALK